MEVDADRVIVEPREVALALLRGAALALPALLLVAAWLGPRAWIGAWLSLAVALSIASLYERRARRTAFGEHRGDACLAWFVAVDLGLALAAAQARFAGHGLPGLELPGTAGVMLVAAVAGLVPAGIVAWTVAIRLEPRERPGLLPLVGRFAPGGVWWGLLAGYPVFVFAVIVTPVHGATRAAEMLALMAALFAAAFLGVVLPALALYGVLAALDRLEARLAPPEPDR